MGVCEASEEGMSTSVIIVICIAAAVIGIAVVVSICIFARVIIRRHSAEKKEVPLFEEGELLTLATSVDNSSVASFRRAIAVERDDITRLQFERGAPFVLLEVSREVSRNDMIHIFTITKSLILNFEAVKLIHVIFGQFYALSTSTTTIFLSRRPFKRIKDGLNLFGKTALFGLSFGLIFSSRLAETESNEEEKAEPEKESSQEAKPEETKPEETKPEETKSDEIHIEINDNQSKYGNNKTINATVNNTVDSNAEEEKAQEDNDYYKIMEKAGDILGENNLPENYYNIVNNNVDTGRYSDLEISDEQTDNIDEIKAKLNEYQERNNFTYIIFIWIIFNNIYIVFSQYFISI